MYVFVMRHGEAQPPMFSDRERQLTDKGCLQVADTANWLRENYLSGAHVEMLINSPYERTRQTKNIIAQHIDSSILEESEDITPSGNPQMFHDYLDCVIESNELSESVMLVSHMPFVSYMVDALTQHNHSMLFATAAVAVIDYDWQQSKGVLTDHYYPQL